MGSVKEIGKNWSIFDHTVIMVSSLPPYAVLVVVSKKKIGEDGPEFIPENCHTKVAGNELELK